MIRKQLFAILLSLAFIFAPVIVEATQPNDPVTNTINLTMNIPASASASCQASANFTPTNAVGGVIPADSSVTCVGSWTTGAGMGYSKYWDTLGFSSTTAMSNGVTNIPTANFFADLAPSPTDPCTNQNNSCIRSDGTVGGFINITSSNYSGSVNRNFYFAINTNGLNLTAGSYTGTLTYTFILGN